MRVIKGFLQVVFQEVPNEISLAISASGCGKSCKGCHTPELQNKYLGDEFTLNDLKSLLAVYSNYITCVLFFGGDFSYSKDLQELLRYIKENTTLKTCLYTGNNDVDADIKQHLDYLKVGEFREECGGLSSKNTNQRFYSVNNNKDLTYRFWR